MKKLLLSIAIVLGGGGGLTYSSSLHATTQRYNTHPTKFFTINEVEAAFADLPGYQKVDISGPIVPWNKMETYDQSKIINIVYVSGSKYQHYTYTSLISILENSKPEEREEPIRFTIILDEIGPEGRSTFNGTLDDDMRRSTNALFLEFNRDIYRYDIEYIPIPDRERERINQFETACYLSNSMFPKLFFSNSPPPETTSYWPKNIFLKLFFSNFFSYERCIYLDGDTVCVNNIRRLWNIDLGEHCFAGLVRQSNSFWVINAGCLLYDLQKMKNVSFASEIEEILKQNQKNPSHHTEALEEHALYAYSAKHGHYVIGPEFNMGKDVVPYEFNEVIEKDNKHPTIVHYYGRPKPPEIIKRYEKVNCPDYKNLQHPFWKSYWKYSPWAFWVWCKYYKKYCEIKDLTKLDW